MRTPSIAKESMGFCLGCGVQVEAGEAISLMNGRATHVDCRDFEQKLEQARTEKRESEPLSGFLFSDMEKAVIEDAQTVLGVKRVSFDGATVLQIDVPRLAGQLARVFELMRDGTFRTLAQIAGAADCLETSASARLRDFRKTRFGSHTVISRQVEGSPLLYEYKLIVTHRKEADGERNAA